MAVGVKTNNPGNLTVTGPNSILYPGQTGVYQANGLNYAVFPDPQTGANALLNYLGNNVGQTPDLLTTPSQLAGYYLNGDPDSIQPTAANPNPSSWLTTITKALGIGANDQIPAGSNNVIAGAIQKAEGNTALGNLFSSPLPGSSVVDSIGSSVSNLASNIVSGAETALGIGSGPTLGDILGMTNSSGSKLNNPAALGSSGTNSSTTSSNGILSFISNLFSLNTGERVIAVIVGGGLILITITILIAENKTVQQTVSKVAAVAA